MLFLVYASRMTFYELLRERVFLRDDDGVYPLWYVDAVILLCNRIPCRVKVCSLKANIIAKVKFIISLVLPSHLVL